MYKGLAIKNEYSYVVALLMRQTTENGSPDLKLQRVIPNQRNARNVIQGNLQNPNGTYLNQLATKTIITKKGSSEALYTDEQSDMQMAPNSNFNLSVPLKGDRLKAGKYTMKIEAYGQTGFKMAAIRIQRRRQPERRKLSATIGRWKRISRLKQMWLKN